jgi:acyl-coenzyme A thioesterase PaaI-like protein
MSSFEPRHSGFESRVRDSFAEQKLMETIGASLISVLPGAVEIDLPFSEAFTQQNGYLHAGIITAIVDSACGYAALSLMP